MFATLMFYIFFYSAELVKIIFIYVDYFVENKHVFSFFYGKNLSFKKISNLSWSACQDSGKFVELCELSDFILCLLFLSCKYPSFLILILKKRNHFNRLRVRQNLSCMLTIHQIMANESNGMRTCVWIL